jgi:hypothetical protein
VRRVKRVASLQLIKAAKEAVSKTKSSIRIMEYGAVMMGPSIKTHVRIGGRLASLHLFRSCERVQSA